MIDKDKLLCGLSRIKDIHSKITKNDIDSTEGMTGELLSTVNLYIITIIDKIEDDVKSGFFDK